MHVWSHYFVDQMRQGVLGRSCGTHGDEERCHRTLMGNQKKESGKRWEDNIKTGFKDIGWEGMDWVCLGSGYGQVAGSCH